MLSDVVLPLLKLQAATTPPNYLQALEPGLVYLIAFFLLSCSSHCGIYLASLTPNKGNYHI